MIMESVLFAGFCSRSDGKISSMQAKKEGVRTCTAILPGDVLTLELSEDSSESYVKKIKKTDSCCCIYGVAVNGIVKYTVPVLLRGHVIAHLDSSVFTNVKVGEYLQCPEICGGQDCACCCKILVVRKLKGLRNEKKVDCYEVFVK